MDLLGERRKSACKLSERERLAGWVNPQDIIQTLPRPAVTVSVSLSDLPGGREKIRKSPMDLKADDFAGLGAFVNPTDDLHASASFVSIEYGFSILVD